MITGSTKSGFTYSIPENNFDDMRLVDALSEIANDGNTLAISQVTKLMLGKEQRDALYAHVRREDGTVPPDAVANELMEILQAKGKNS